jgi:hypothetical protein
MRLGVLPVLRAGLLVATVLARPPVIGGEVVRTMLFAVLLLPPPDVRSDLLAVVLFPALPLLTLSRVAFLR